MIRLNPNSAASLLPQSLGFKFLPAAANVQDKPVTFQEIQKSLQNGHNKITKLPSPRPSTPQPADPWGYDAFYSNYSHNIESIKRKLRQIIDSLGQKNNDLMKNLINVNEMMVRALDALHSLYKSQTPDQKTYQDMEFFQAEDGIRDTYEQLNKIQGDFDFYKTGLK